MVGNSSSTCLLSIVFFLLVTIAAIPYAGAVGTGRPLREKLSNIKIFWHDIVAGNNQSSVCVVPPVNGTISPAGGGGGGFGAVNMIDNPITAGPDLGSNLLGRAQGLYADASQHDSSFLMAMNFFFTTGKYNQSTLTLVGRNSILQPTREVSVVGGSGLFRFARGYAILKTVRFEATVATVLYDIHVLHY